MPKTLPQVEKAVIPVNRTNLSRAVFEQLVSFVVKGDWKPGSRIPAERELCAKFGIARTSLREALKAMELVGMLDSRVGHGTFVCARAEFLSRPMLWAFSSTDHNELMDIIEARVLLEQDLAGLAAKRASQAEIEQLGDAVEWMRKNTAENQSIMEPDMAFHLTIGLAAHNAMLNNAVQLLRNMLRQWIYLKLKLLRVPNQVEEHEAIYEAVRRRDPAAARQAMKDHLEHTGTLIGQVAQEIDRQPEAASGGY